MFEAGKTYRTRGGKTATVIEETGESPWPLAVRYSSDYTDVVTADGRRWDNGTDDLRDLLPGAIDAETPAKPGIYRVDTGGGYVWEGPLPEENGSRPPAPTPETETIWDRDARAALPAALSVVNGNASFKGMTTEQLCDNAAALAGMVADALAAIRAERRG